MSGGERAVRSKLAQIVSSKEFVRGNITLRRDVCGNPNCKCAKGERHLCLYLSQSRRGKPKQLYIPWELEKEAKEWTKEYSEIKELLEKISGISWKRLKNREV
jgi:hypothetical protein